MTPRDTTELTFEERLAILAAPTTESILSHTKLSAKEKINAFIHTEEVPDSFLYLFAASLARQVIYRNQEIGKRSPQESIQDTVDIFLVLDVFLYARGEASKEVLQNVRRTGHGATMTSARETAYLAARDTSWWEAWHARTNGFEKPYEGQVELLLALLPINEE